MARTVRLESLDDPRLDAYARLTEQVNTGIHARLECILLASRVTERGTERFPGI